MTEQVIQNFVFPRIDFGAPEEMYVRLHNNDVSAHYLEHKLIFRPGGVITFDTFFGGLNVGVWRLRFGVDSLGLSLRGKGRFLVRVGLHRIGNAHRWVEEHLVEIRCDENVSLPIERWNSLSGGMLYVQLQALEPSTLEHAAFTSSCPVREKVKLGVVMTHFRREGAVQSAIEILRNELLQMPDCAGNIELVVVDNSRSLEVSEVDGVTILPNENFGGSGGFTRGLLFLKDRGDFTHCLFMDDDAVCEPESIRRAWMMLQFADDSRFAVSGSLLRELEPYRLLEMGARFDGFVHPLKGGLDVRYVHDLLVAERSEERAHYGAWWFFAFRIEDVSHFAFPFFVRGDDIRFGIDNNFEILNMNGIACWGEDFGLKSGPITAYFDTRNHLIQAILLGEKNCWGVGRLAFDFFCAHLFSYNYASASASRMALEHVSLGPGFFAENLDATDIRRQINEFSSAEKLAPLRRSEIDLVFPSRNDSWMQNVLRWVTLNGFLLPRFFIKDDTVIQDKGFRGVFREIFRHRRVFYEYKPSEIGYFAVHDKRKFFRELITFSWPFICFLKNFRALRHEFLTDYPHLTSEAFWRSVYHGQLDQPESVRRFSLGGISDQPVDSCGVR